MIVPFVEQVEHSNLKYLSKLDDEMSQLARSKLKPDQKVKIYNDRLEKFKSQLPDEQIALQQQQNQPDSHWPEIQQHLKQQKLQQEQLHQQQLQQHQLQQHQLLLQQKLLEQDNEPRASNRSKPTVPTRFDKTLNEIFKLIQSHQEEISELKELITPETIYLNNKRTRKSVEPFQIKHETRKPVKLEPQPSRKSRSVQKNLNEKIKQAVFDKLNITEDLDQEGSGWISRRNYFK